MKPFASDDPYLRRAAAGSRVIESALTPERLSGCLPPLMQGYIALVLHAHLPFVRHPEHERFLEESWLFEAITETYIPLLQLLESWEQDSLDAPLTLSLTPTLCCMLGDPLLQERYTRRLEALIDLAEKEKRRTRWEQSLSELAHYYHRRLSTIRDFYLRRKRDLLGAFRQLQDRGRLEIMASAATHAVLPLLAGHPPSVRAQILVGRDHYCRCFGREPRGVWLPECGYCPAIEPALREANLRWFIVDTHGLLRARPQPRYAVFAPILTPSALAAFGRDPDSARQVWSREEGYPGDPRYREFYRDIGFDLDWEYVRPYVPAADQRGFTGIKYHRITQRSENKEVYDESCARQAAAEHAEHFLQARQAQIDRLAGILDRPPIVVCPYDAELFGHWWYEGPEFLDRFIQKIRTVGQSVALTTPELYLTQYPKLQVATPAASSWGEEGYWRVWLNQDNEWIYPHLQVAQERMSQLARRTPAPGSIEERALKQAARELLLAQASDWPFILRSGTSPDYARRRAQEHLLRFSDLYQQIMAMQIHEQMLRQVETQDNLFPEINYRYWAEG
jgi:1,4-alpha-glucan branching enzyme